MTALDKGPPATLPFSLPVAFPLFPSFRCTSLSTLLYLLPVMCQAVVSSLGEAAIRGGLLLLVGYAGLVLPLCSLLLCP